MHRGYLCSSQPPGRNRGEASPQRTCNGSGRPRGARVDHRERAQGADRLVNWHMQSRRLGQYARLFITRKDAYGLVSYLQPSDLGQDLLETSAPFRRGFLLTLPGNLCARGPLFLRPRSLPLLALISLAPAGLYALGAAAARTPGFDSAHRPTNIPACCVLSRRRLEIENLFLREPLINLRIMAHCAFDSRATVWTGS